MDLISSVWMWLIFSCSTVLSVLSEAHQNPWRYRHSLGAFCQRARRKMHFLKLLSDGHSQVSLCLESLNLGSKISTTSCYCPKWRVEEVVVRFNAGIFTFCFYLLLAIAKIVSTRLLNYKYYNKLLKNCNFSCKIGFQGATWNGKHKCHIILISFLFFLAVFFFFWKQSYLRCLQDVLLKMSQRRHNRNIGRLNVLSGKCSYKIIINTYELSNVYSLKFEMQRINRLNR